MRVRVFELDAGAVTIGSGGDSSDGFNQPVDSRGAQQVVLGTQIKVFGDIGTTGRTRSLLRLS